MLNNISFSITPQSHWAAVYWNGEQPPSTHTHPALHRLLQYSTWDVRALNIAPLSIHTSGSSLLILCFSPPCLFCSPSFHCSISHSLLWTALMQRVQASVWYSRLGRERKTHDAIMFCNKQSEWWGNYEDEDGVNDYTNERNGDGGERNDSNADESGDGGGRGRGGSGASSLPEMPHLLWGPDPLFSSCHCQWVLRGVCMLRGPLCILPPLSSISCPW